MSVPRCLLALCAVALIAAISACGGGAGRTAATDATQSEDALQGKPGYTQSQTVVPTPRDAFEPPEVVESAACPTDTPGCRSAKGRILYVERHDPDGDGDAHFVILDPQGITFTGITAIDVEVGLRPTPLPGVGDLISAAGPVQTGSYGQEQIHALVLNVGVPVDQKG